MKVQIRFGSNFELNISIEKVFIAALLMLH